MATNAVSEVIGTVGGSLLGGLEEAGLYSSQGIPIDWTSPELVQGQYSIAGYDQYSQALQAGQQQSELEAAQSREAQAQLLAQLQQQASGRGPSIATAQYQQGLEQNLAAAQAMAASQRGMGSVGSNLALASQARAQATQQTARDAAIARMQEQLAARQQLGSLASNMRGQDISSLQYYLSQGMSLDQAQAQLQLQGDQAYNEALLQRAAIEAQVAQQQAQMQQQAQGGLIGAIGGAIGAFAS